MSKKTKAAPAPAPATATPKAAPEAPATNLKAGDKVSFAAPLGMTNTGVVEKIVDGVAAVEVDKPIVTFPVGQLTKV